MNATSNQYCVVRCREMWYAMPSTSVREVMLSPDVAPLPNMSNVMRGIAHVNNEFLTITDPLASEDRGAELQGDRARQLIVLSSCDGYWGVLVDEVAGLTDLGTIQPNRTIDRHVQMVGDAIHKGNKLRIVDVESTYRAVMAEVKANWQQGFRSFELAQETQS